MSQDISSINYFAIAWSPDGSMLATGAKNLSLWDTTRGELIRTIDGHDDTIQDVCWSPDGLYLLTASADGTIAAWDPISEENILKIERAHAGLVRCVRWNEDGSLIASGGDDGLVKTWDAQTGHLIESFPGHKSHSKEVYWNHTDGTLISSGTDGSIKLWNPSVSGAWRSFAEVTGFAYNAAGTEIATLAIGSHWSDGANPPRNREIKILDTFDGTLLTSIPLEDTFDPPVYSIDWSQNNKRIAIGSVAGNGAEHFSENSIRVTKYCPCQAGCLACRWASTRFHVRQSPSYKSERARDMGYRYRRTYPYPGRAWRGW
jgi:WD40 repeat protein